MFKRLLFILIVLLFFSCDLSKDSKKLLDSSVSVKDFFSMSENWKIKLFDSQSKQTFYIRDDGINDDKIASAEKYKLGTVDNVTHKWYENKCHEWGYHFVHLPDGAQNGAPGPSVPGGYSADPATRQDALYVIKEYLRNPFYVKDSGELEEMRWMAMSGHYPWHHYAGEWGSEALGSELGENIDSYQTMVAFNRGAVRQYQVPWFIDVSPWHGPSFTKTSGEPDIYGSPEGGHSLSLYERTYVYSFMSGCSAVEAEAGGMNFFLNEKNNEGFLEPSSLGYVGQKIQAFMDDVEDEIIPYTPFAVFAGYEHGYFMGDHEWKAFGFFPYQASDYMLYDIIETFFPGCTGLKGNEKDIMVATPYGDTLDVLLQGGKDEYLSQELLNSYPVLIPAGEIKFKARELKLLKNYVEQGGILVANSAYYKQLHTIFQVDYIFGLKVFQIKNGCVIFYDTDYNTDFYLKKILDSLAPSLHPFKVNGKVQYLFTAFQDGWYVTLINNDGVTKDFKTPPEVDESKKVSVSLEGSVGYSSIWNLLDKSESYSISDKINITLGPGEVKVLEIRR